MKEDHHHHHAEDFLLFFGEAAQNKARHIRKQDAATEAQHNHEQQARYGNEAPRLLRNHSSDANGGGAEFNLQMARLVIVSHA